jgi:DnaK suppressor protein
LNSKTPGLDKAFVERQRKRLIRLRAEIVDATQARVDDESSVNAQSAGEAQESEDDAQRLTTLELDGNLVARDLQRLAQIKRALEKIDEGSYGLSDASGHVIPLDRLEALPEATLTVAEQESRKPG